MIEETRYRRLAAALRDNIDAHTASWEEIFATSPLRLPGSYDRADARRAVLPIFENLADALPLAALIPGSAEVREIEKSTAFLGSLAGGMDSSGFDVAGMVTAIRDLLLDHVEDDELADFTGFFEWLIVLALESFSTARAQAENERQRDLLERGTPVILVTPGVPAVLLVGAPDNIVLDSVFGRLLMLTVRVGAPAVIIDATGLAEPCAPPVLLAVDHLLRHTRLVDKVTVVAVGLDDDDQSRWQQLADRAHTPFHCEPSFDRALVSALGHSEYRLVRRPSR